MIWLYFIIVFIAWYFLVKLVKKESTDPVDHKFMVLFGWLPALLWPILILAYIIWKIT
jgi:nucleoside recognition membrane protein YjiH